MSRFRRVRLASVVTIALVATVPLACTSETNEFCNQLRADYDLQGLRLAIQRNDKSKMASELTKFRDLTDAAPPEISADMSKINDAVDETVRAVTGIPDDQGQQVPVDLSTLTAKLSGISTSSQHVADFADKKCGVSLDS